MNPNRLVFGLLSVLSQLVFVTLFAQNANSSIPSINEATTYIKNICGTNINQEKGIVFCKKCPSFTGSPDGGFLFYGFALQSIIHGSFSKIGIHEALLDFNGCEPHSTHFGGTVLLRRINQKWSFIRYEAGWRSDSCLKFAENSGRDSLVCENFDGGHGRQNIWIESIKFNSASSIRTNILIVSSNLDSCHTPYHKVEIKDFRLQNTNKRGFPNLIVKLYEAKGLDNKSANNCEKTIFGKSKLHLLTFFYNGKSFHPMPDTAKFLQSVESK